MHNQKSLLKSYGHAILSKEMSLAVLCSWLQEKSSANQRKHKLRYAECCNSFITDQFSSRESTHRKMDILGVFDRLTETDITEEAVDRYLTSKGVVRGDLVQFPSIDLTCQEYHLDERWRLGREIKLMSPFNEPSPIKNKEGQFYRSEFTSLRKRSVSCEPVMKDSSPDQTPLKKLCFQTTNKHSG